MRAEASPRSAAESDPARAAPITSDTARDTARASTARGRRPAPKPPLRCMGAIAPRPPQRLISREPWCASDPGATDRTGRVSPSDPTRDLLTLIQRQAALSPTAGLGRIPPTSADTYSPSASASRAGGRSPPRSTPPLAAPRSRPSQPRLNGSDPSASPHLTSLVSESLTLSGWCRHDLNPPLDATAERVPKRYASGMRSPESQCSREVRPGTPMFREPR